MLTARPGIPAWHDRIFKDASRSHSTSVAHFAINIQSSYHYRAEEMLLFHLDHRLFWSFYSSWLPGTRRTHNWPVAKVKRSTDQTKPQSYLSPWDVCSRLLPNSARHSARLTRNKGTNNQNSQVPRMKNRLLRLPIKQTLTTPPRRCLYRWVHISTHSTLMLATSKSDV